MKCTTGIYKKFEESLYDYSKSIIDKKIYITVQKIEAEQAM